MSEACFCGGEAQQVVVRPGPDSLEEVRCAAARRSSDCFVVCRVAHRASTPFLLSTTPPPRESTRAPTPHRPAPHNVKPQSREPRVRALWLTMETFEMAQKTTLSAKEKSVDDARGTHHCGRNEMWLECIVI